jgi:hypothetical protein
MEKVIGDGVAELGEGRTSATASRSLHHHT